MSVKQAPGNAAEGIRFIFFMKDVLFISYVKSFSVVMSGRLGF